MDSRPTSAACVDGRPFGHVSVPQERPCSRVLCRDSDSHDDRVDWFAAAQSAHSPGLRRSVAASAKRVPHRDDQAGQAGEPRATFEVGSFLDAAIPPCAAIVAIGEVFGYVASGTGRPVALGWVFARCHDALDPGGLLMFDLAGPGRLQAREQPGWTAGPGWVVLVETHVESDTLSGEIVTFRRCGRSRYRRSEETRRLQLHRPVDVLAQLRRNRFTARTPRLGYGTITLPSGPPRASINGKGRGQEHREESLAGAPA